MSGGLSRGNIRLGQRLILKGGVIPGPSLGTSSSPPSPPSQVWHTPPSSPSPRTNASPKTKQSVNAQPQNYKAQLEQQKETMEQQSLELDNSKKMQKKLVNALAMQLAMTPDNTKIEMERLRRKNRKLEEHERTLQEVMKILREAKPHLFLPRMLS